MSSRGIGPQNRYAYLRASVSSAARQVSASVPVACSRSAHIASIRFASSSSTNGAILVRALPRIAAAAGWGVVVAGGPWAPLPLRGGHPAIVARTEFARLTSDDLSRLTPND